MKVFKWALAGASGLAVAGFIAVTALGAGVSQAEEPPGGRIGKYGEALAERLGISVEELRADPRGAMDDALDAAVASGRLTQEQADKIREHPGKALRLGGAFLRGALGDVFAAAAETLDMSKEELKAELKSGKSLAGVAAAEGLSPEALKVGITAEIDAQLDAAVASGKITQERADKIAAGLASRLDKIIQHQGGNRPGNNP